MEDSSRYDLPDSPRSVGWTAAEHCVVADAASPFLTESGAVLPYVEVEYETYGTPAADGNNCVLVCHALSGDAHAAGWDAHWERDNRPWRKDRPGWWDNVIGPGKGIDTNRWFVICSNVLGGCYGTTGPASVNPETGRVNPETGRPYGLEFPVVTVGDWVRIQKRLLEKLGITHLYAVIGGSLGGQQTLEWALAYPDFMEKAVILASADKLSPQGLAFNTVGRHSIMSDPHFCGGDYYGKEKPDKGLAMARMLANITYLSEESFHDKFGREFQSKVTSTIKDFRLFIVSMPTLTFTSPKRWTITTRRPSGAAGIRPRRCAASKPNCCLSASKPTGSTPPNRAWKSPKWPPVWGDRSTTFWSIQEKATTAFCWKPKRFPASSERF